MLIAMRRDPISAPDGGGRARYGRRWRVLAAALVAVGVAVPGAAPGAAASDASAMSVSAHIHDAGAVGDGLTTCAPTPDGAGTTCTGTFIGRTAYDAMTDSMIAASPTVTVDQTTDLTNQMVHVTWTGFTPSMTSVDSNFVPGYAPVGPSWYGVSVYQCKGTAPADLVADCNDQFTNVGVSTSGVQPTGIETLTRSGRSTSPTECLDPADPLCGTGFADIQVQTSAENNLLGCDDLNPCSIVVVPNWGGDYGTQGGVTTEACTDHSADFDGVSDTALNTNRGEDNPCSWEDRIVVPVHLAKTPKQYCPANDDQFVAEGSAALERAMNQWRPAWCTSTQKLSFGYDSAVNEYQARTHFLSGNAALTAGTDVALVTDPASADLAAASSRKFTYAPVATTAISIAYYIDDQATSEPVTDLKLNARLVAKLLTESYTLQYTRDCPSKTQTEFCDIGVQGNPGDIFQDKEFYQLNPQYTQASFNDQQAFIQGDFYPIVLAGDSDLTYELTRWVVSDPDARAFLEGKPDPWGTHVNTYYQTGQTYPISQFQILDPGFAVPGAASGQYSVAMQVAWNPVTGLDNVAAHLANWTSSAIQPTLQCVVANTNPPCPLTNPKAAPENFPARTLFAIMDQGTASAFRFPTAQLVDPAGKAVGPTTDAMAAAVYDMKSNPDGITQYQDFGATLPNAYPLTEVQYAMVPTCGLSQGKAAAISAFLNEVAGSAQTLGVDLGDLPPFGGYIPLDNVQRGQTLAAAKAVSTQPCTSPVPDTTVSGQQVGSNGAAGGGFGAGVPANPLTPAVAPAAAHPGATPSIAPTRRANGQQPVGLGVKSADSNGLAHTVLIVGLVLGALLALGGPLAYAAAAGGLKPLSRRRPSPGGPASGDGPGAGSEGGDV